MIAAYSSAYTARSLSVCTVVDSRLLVFVKRDHSLAVCCPANRRRRCRQTPLHSQRACDREHLRLLTDKLSKKPEISATNAAIASTHQYRVGTRAFLSVLPFISQRRSRPPGATFATFIPDGRRLLTELVDLTVKNAEPHPAASLHPLKVGNHHCPKYYWLTTIRGLSRRSRCCSASKGTR
jgi:hypothetical protein